MSLAYANWVECVQVTHGVDLVSLWRGFLADYMWFSVIPQHTLLGVLLRSDVEGGRQTRTQTEVAREPYPGYGAGLT